MTKRSKTPWPTKAAMTQIYEQHLWGGKAFDFYSGEGSHDPKIVEPYLKAVISFLQSHNNQLTVCDLGCGDFNIGKQLIKHTKTYIAVDIVDSLIERNKIAFKDEHLEFQCLDITKNNLPAADCVIIRQVLQHLSNTEILKITEKLMQYKYIILTEHIPVGHFKANKNIISGQGNRLKYHSGVNLLAEPFHLKIAKHVTLNTTVLDKGQILTTLYTL